VRPIKLTPEAKDDLKNILKHTQKVWGEPQRKIYKAHFDKAFALLSEFPEGGIRRDELFIGCRCRRVEQHIIFYRIQPNTVQVVRIFHVRMDIESRLQDF
jgi:toxin ParE1/3/4